MSSTDRLPWVEELDSPADPEEWFLRLASLPHPIFFDSALVHPTLGRYSFLAADPFEFLTASPGESGSLAKTAARLGLYRSPTVPGLPPFQGGAAGLWCYELGRQLERLPEPVFREFDVPDAAVGLYDAVLAVDHQSKRSWIISQGFPETEPAARLRRARRRADELRDRLTRPPVAASPPLRRPLPLKAPCYASRRDGLLSNFTPGGYRQAVARTIEYILAGDVFQVNLSQRLLYPACDDAVSLYRRLRRCNPAPFAGYFDAGDYQVVSASPERFLRLQEGRVETRPIKGTRRRTGCEATDRAAAAELAADEKERSENVMIVDLLRNDLARVCRPESVCVSQLCGIEEYAFVQHLVSAVEGRLREGLGAFDLIRAAFPGGSVTGAPKIRAMEIITELERTARGPYCGSLGYVGFDGNADLNLLIRTITAGGGWWQLPVGGGIVALSDPEREYEETWEKAEGLLRALP